MGDDLIRREKYLNNCKPAMIQSRKSGSNINAKDSIQDLEERLALAEAKLAARLGSGQFAYAQAA